MIVRFLVQSSCVPVEKHFRTYEEGMKFVQKIKRSKKVKLLSFSYTED